MRKGPPCLLEHITCISQCLSRSSDARPELQALVGLTAELEQKGMDGWLPPQFTPHSPGGQTLRGPMQPPSDESSRPGDVVTGPFLGMCPEKESEKSPLSPVFSQGHESHHQGGILMTNQNQIPPQRPHLQILSPWGPGCEQTDQAGEVGHKHSGPSSAQLESLWELLRLPLIRHLSAALMIVSGGWGPTPCVSSELPDDAAPPVFEEHWLPKTGVLTVSADWNYLEGLSGNNRGCGPHPGAF